MRAAAPPARQAVTLESLLEWSWNEGIAVLSLSGPGGFAASARLLNGRNVIVLKRTEVPAAYWLFDLALELRAHLGGTALVDVNPPLSKTDDPEERAANRRALDLLLPDHEEMVSRVDELSHDDGVAIKVSVELVARDGGVSAGLLGLVAAFELTDLGRQLDSWESATNLAKVEGAGRPGVARMAAERLRVEELTELDRQLMQAVVFASTGT